MPKLLKITRSDSAVRFKHEVQGETLKVPDPKAPGKTMDHTSLEERDVTAHEAPLKSFDDALQNLATVAVAVLELGVQYANGITISGLSVSYTKRGTRSACIFFSKHLDKTSQEHRMATPVFQIDEPKDSETQKRQCTPTQAKAVADMIREANKYAAGKRSQQMLDFGDKRGAGDDDEEAGAKTEPLQFEAEGAGNN